MGLDPIDQYRKLTRLIWEEAQKDPSVLDFLEKSLGTWKGVGKKDEGESVNIPEAMLRIAESMDTSFKD